MGAPRGHVASEKDAAKRWNGRKEARPAEIVAAAVGLLRRARLRPGTRLDDVAARAGVTKGTVYLYFPNKEELFKAVIRQSLLPHLERVMGNLAGASEDPVERIRRLPTFFARSSSIHHSRSSRS